MGRELYLGIDVGSVSVKIVLLSPEGHEGNSKQIIYHSYTRSEGQPFKVLLTELQK